MVDSPRGTAGRDLHDHHLRTQSADGPAARPHAGDPRSRELVELARRAVAIAGQVERHAQALPAGTHGVLAGGQARGQRRQRRSLADRTGRSIRVADARTEERRTEEGTAEKGRRTPPALITTEARRDSAQSTQ